MTAATDKPPVVNGTAARRVALRPGEAFFTTGGDFAADVASSKGAPAYARLLGAVERAAHELQAVGRIMVRESTVWLTREGQRFTVLEYRAFGLAAPQAGDDEIFGTVPDEAAAA
jgi:hypothetical protein